MFDDQRYVLNPKKRRRIVHVFNADFCYNSYNKFDNYNKQRVRLVLSAERKILKIGNSLGVTFPVEFLNQLGIHQGD
jgi:hypothetical protein